MICCYYSYHTAESSAIRMLNPSKTATKSAICSFHPYLIILVKCIKVSRCFGPAHSDAGIGMLLEAQNSEDLECCFTEKVLAEISTRFSITLPTTKTERVSAGRLHNRKDYSLISHGNCGVRIFPFRLRTVPCAVPGVGRGETGMALAGRRETPLPL